MISNPDMLSAAVLDVVGKPLVIKELKVPKLLPGQVLVKIHFSGVCRSQLMEVRGFRGPDKWTPHLLGHEGSGTIVQVGPRVTKFSVGDDVILGWIVGEGMDAPGARYKDGQKTINSGQVTTFSNYTIVSENRLVKKPKGLPFDQAVLFGCALPTGAGLVLNEIKPKQDHSVVVIGLGGIGMASVIALNALGVRKIIAIDTNRKKLELARYFGASDAIHPQDSPVKDQCFKLLPDGADFCVESAGSVATIEMGFSLINPQKGELVFASHPPEGDQIKLSPHELITGKKIYGSWGGGVKPDRDVPRIYNMLANADIHLEPLISKSYQLEDINAALRDLEEGKVHRPLIVMNHS